MKSKTLLLVSSFLFCTSAFGQIAVEPDFDLWNGGVTNPSGLAAIPILQYNPANGEMWINTVGLNGVSDTTGRQFIEGDDVGMNSISVESPPAIETASEFMGFHDGIVWSEQYFNSKQQIFTTGNGFLRPSQGMRMWTFDAGLTPDDFGLVEMSVFFGSGISPPGGAMFGGVQFVPEPSALVTFLMATILALAFTRKSRL
ncbi:MAG: hypothetical protein AAF497_21520 [Planctomycetota bacterium]